MAFDIFWMNVAAIFAFANVGLVFLLVAFYFQSWRRIKSSISASLIIFAVFFLVQNFVIIVFWLVLYGLAPQAPLALTIVEGGAPYLVAINALETIGLGNLVRITWK